ncbi:hypothetical protein Sjap_002634 [Stephania japonica]|uniref:Uncharacterized protein n=1 Tax=Stephania japonica TaxID=461633 RepID=A0AAP0PUQ1_9MAGN
MAERDSRESLKIWETAPARILRQIKQLDKKRSLACPRGETLEVFIKGKHEAPKARVKNKKKKVLSQQKVMILLTKKIGNLGAVEIPVWITGNVYEKALLDIGAEINVTPLSIFEKTELMMIDIEKVNITLGNERMVTAVRKNKSVRINGGQFIYEVDFYVLDASKIPVEITYGDPCGDHP